MSKLSRRAEVKVIRQIVQSQARRLTASDRRSIRYFRELFRAMEAECMGNGSRKDFETILLKLVDLRPLREKPATWGETRALQREASRCGRCGGHREGAGRAYSGNLCECPMDED